MVDHAIQTLTDWFYVALAFVAGVLGLIDATLHRGLSRVGVPSDVQVLLLLVVDIFLIVLVFRAFGGVIRALLIVFLILLVLHILASMAGFEFAHPISK